jgi:hypothetical protein
VHAMDHKAPAQKVRVVYKVYENRI